MIDSIQLLKFVIRPVLQNIGLWSIEAEQLVLGTACKESECGRWLKQLNNGPALGIYQMEPATHDDLWKNFSWVRKNEEKLFEFVGHGSRWPEAKDMVGNLDYATAMCRVHYLRMPEPIPVGLRKQAEYWKKFYNTPLGAGKVDEYIQSWERFVGN